MKPFIYFLHTVAIISILINFKTIECTKKRGINNTAKGSLKEYRLFSYNSTTTNKLSDSTLSENYLSKRRHVDRVSRKQYEIVNMLWKKTKIFIEIDHTPTLSSTTKTKNQSSVMNNQQTGKISLTPFRDMFHLKQPRTNLQSSTPSYIEFYYLDETDQSVNHKNLINPKATDTSKTHSFNERMIFLPRHPFFAFKINDATCPLQTNTYLAPSQTTAVISTKGVKYTTQKLSVTDKTPVSSRSENLSEKTISSSKELDDGTCINTIESSSLDTKVLENLKAFETKSTSKIISLLEKSVSNNAVTSANDRIKFFEIYDSDTYTPYTLFSSSTWHTRINDDTNNNNKFELEQVDLHFGNHYNVNRTRFVKKHANYFDKREEENFKITTKNYNLVNSHTPIVKNEELNLTPSKLFNLSKPVQWAKFPFMAVYVYEPSQVRCDCAAVSPHWLVAAAACLYRHHKDPQVDYRSAFVAYCSDNWRHPERIAYVKRSLIHPKFHPRDNVRKHLYNIGAIQVVNSLANTCTGWSSITLISHQFVTDNGGTLATAVGWGLDRYDTSYLTIDLPKVPLMLYEGLVYSKSCPGNFDYMKSKQESEDNVKNVYCLSLPTYSSEDNDVVHGALLLNGGKLIALYLQEERRLWGEQSAQYTGVWRLVPWLLDVAREPEDQDSLSFEI